ncbi:MAG: hypothetical protein V2J10_09790 [Wenzhouxiangella sp.]|nr:hypothetical protein [Wenzhouxiangella sp.]
MHRERCGFRQGLVPRLPFNFTLLKTPFRIEAGSSTPGSSY